MGFVPQKVFQKFSLQECSPYRGFTVCCVSHPLLSSHIYPHTHPSTCDLPYQDKTLFKALSANWAECPSQYKWTALAHVYLFMSPLSWCSTQPVTFLESCWEFNDMALCQFCQWQICLPSPSLMSCWRRCLICLIPTSWYKSSHTLQQIPPHAYLVPLASLLLLWLSLWIEPLFANCFLTFCMVWGLGSSALQSNFLSVHLSCVSNILLFEDFRFELIVLLPC